LGSRPPPNGPIPLTWIKFEYRRRPSGGALLFNVRHGQPGHLSLPANKFIFLYFFDRIPSILAIALEFGENGGAKAIQDILQGILRQLIKMQRRQNRFVIFFSYKESFIPVGQKHYINFEEM
jgi:hypothetical protein